MKEIEPIKNEISAVINSLPGWCWPEKAERLAQLVIDHKVHTAVEIGVFGGRSLLPMAIAMRHQGFGKTVGIDPWTVEAALEGDNSKENDLWWSTNANLEGTYEAFVYAVASRRLLPWCFWHRCKSEVAANLFPINSVGLIHCDGNHSELASCKDVNLWLPRLRPGGIWVMDDITWATQTKAVESLKAAGLQVLEEVIQPNKGSYMVFQKTTLTL